MFWLTLIIGCYEALCTNSDHESKEWSMYLFRVEGLKSDTMMRPHRVLTGWINRGSKMKGIRAALTARRHLHGKWMFSTYISKALRWNELLHRAQCHLHVHGYSFTGSEAFVGEKIALARLREYDSLIATSHTRKCLSMWQCVGNVITSPLNLMQYGVNIPNRGY